jgi:hypothetical protein
MKMRIVLSLATALALPALAHAAEAPAPATPAPAAEAVGAAAGAGAAPATSANAAKKVELMDGSWALVEGENVKLSSDGGKTWTPAPDTTLEAKDGSKLATKDGKIAK